ncbi:hypothetical protein V8J88_07700 [Massilia sp. W12]|uniref:hypothetical protein n=1 Tax=Massilia sp. W12 TaxID=3126507 RepID=UPI0030D373B1
MGMHRKRKRRLHYSCQKCGRHGLKQHELGQRIMQSIAALSQQERLQMLELIDQLLDESRQVA